MKYEVYFTELADGDVDGVLDYIAHDSVANALNFVARLQERIEKILGTTPYAGNNHGDVRYFAFDNYVVVYDIDEAEKAVYIHLVSEGHRQWRAILIDRL